MKLATRISSIRRIAWKQCRSWSPASRSMWRDSDASSRLAGWMRSPPASSSLVTGCWASQSTSRSGCSPRSSRAMAMSRRAWPSPIGEDRYSARRRRRSARVQRRSRDPADGRDLVGEVAQQQVGPHRVAGVRPVAGALEHDQRAAEFLGQRHPPSRIDQLDPRCRGGPGWGSAPGRTGSTTVSGSSSLVAQPRKPARMVSASVSSAPADAVLDLLGGVRLGEALGEEPIQVATPVAQPVVAVLLAPSPGRCRAPRRTGRRHLRLPDWQHRGDEDHAGDPLGMLGGQDAASRPCRTRPPRSPAPRRPRPGRPRRRAATSGRV